MVDESRRGRTYGDLKKLWDSVEVMEMNIGFSGHDRKTEA